MKKKAKKKEFPYGTVFFVVLIGLVSAAIFVKPERQAATRPQSAPAPVRDVELEKRAALRLNAPHDEQKAANSYNDSLQESQRLYAKLDAIVSVARNAVKGESAAEHLLEDFALHAVVGRLVSYGQIEMLPRRDINSEKAARLVFIAKKDLRLAPGPLKAPFLFDPTINSVICADIDPVSKGVLATTLLHEIFHWRTFADQGHQITTDPFTDDQLVDEVRAHELEFRAIDRLTHGAFGRAIDEVLRDDTLSTVSIPRQPTKAGWRRLLAAWSEPPLSAFESDIRTSGAHVAFQFAQAPDERSKMKVYAGIRRVFEGSRQRLSE